MQHGEKKPALHKRQIQELRIKPRRCLQVDVMGLAPAEDQGRLLQEAGNAVKRNAFFMKKAMVTSAWVVRWFHAFCD